MSQPTQRPRTTPTPRTIAGALILALAALFAARHARPIAAQADKVRVYLPLVVRAVGRDAFPSAPTAAAATPTSAPSATPSPIVLLTDAPPTDTSTPDVTSSPTPGVLSTEPPTEQPTPTATALPSPTSDGRVCRELMSNGDFEKGPTEWDLVSGFRARTLSQIIRKPESNTVPRPTWGAYFASLGGGDSDVTETLTHPGRPLRAWTTIDTSRLISASLSMDFTMLTDETPNRRDDDTLQPVFVSSEGLEEAVSNAIMSEETVPKANPPVWKHFVWDVSRYVVVRPGWDKFQLRMKSKMSATIPTWHYMDEISLIVCEKPVPAER